MLLASSRAQRQHTGSAPPAAQQQQHTTLPLIQHSGHYLSGAPLGQHIPKHNGEVKAQDAHAEPARHQLPSLLQRMQYTPQHQQQLEHNPQYAEVKQQHNRARSKSLADALRISTADARAMLAACPALRRFNHAHLADKLQDIAALLRVPPGQLSQALVQHPKVLCCSFSAVQRRLNSLSWLQPDRQQLTQMVLQAPDFLMWESHHLRTRVLRMAAALGTDTGQVSLLLQQHPQLLPASSHLMRSLEHLQHLLLLAAASEQSGFGTGVAASLDAATASQQGVMGQRQQQHHQQQCGQEQQQQRQQVAQPNQQRQLGPIPEAITAAAQRLALSHPQLLLLPPEELQLRVAAMQARSGLSTAQVAAILVSQPQLLLKD